LANFLFDVSTAFAIISPCGVYRYALTRLFTPEPKTSVNFLMLNPSKATAEITDPTFTRCIDFAKNWRYDAVVLTNLFALRSTDPRALKTHVDPIGPDNNGHLTSNAIASSLVVAAWGTKGYLFERDKKVLKMLAEAGVKVHRLAITKDGFPQHPLFVPKNVTPVEWER